MSNTTRILVLAFVPLALRSFALTNTVDGVEWRYTIENGEAVLGDGSSWPTAVSADISGAITIPSTLSGFPVTSIGNYSFFGCSNLVSVVIPEGVTNIGAYSFRGCSGLESVEIPNSVSNIGGQAFQDCQSLTAVRIPYGVKTINGQAFYRCYNLSSIEIPNSVTSIETRSFVNCTNLSSILLPNSVTNIGIYAFFGCSGLLSLAIPNGVTSIGDSTFRGCSKLASVLLPDSITNIASRAFHSCSSLTAIDIPNKVEALGAEAFRGCSSVTHLIVPLSVESIGASAFTGTQLQSIYLPSRFEGQTGSFGIPKSCAIRFYDNDLVQVTVGSSLESLVPDCGSWLFSSNATHTLSVDSPKLDGALSGVRYMCTGWTGTGSIPSSGTGTNVSFRLLEDSSLTWNWETQVLVSVTVSGGTSEFGSRWIRAGDSVSTEIVPNSHLYEIVLSGDTNGVSLVGTTLTIPADGPRTITVTVTEVKLALDVATAHGTGLPAAGRTEWSWGDEISARVITEESVEGMRFVCKGWTGTGSVPANGAGTNVTFRILEDSSLTWNWETQVLVSVAVSGGTSEFGEQWFPIGTSTQASFVPEPGYQTIELYGDTNGVMLVGTTLTIPADRPRKILVAVDGIPWNYQIKNGNAVLGGGNSKSPAIPQDWIGDIVIPETLGGCPVTIINSSAFYGCSQLTSVAIPIGVTTIKGYAFHGCSGLVSITIPAGVTNIENLAFAYCSRLPTIAIPNEVSSIGANAFKGCSELTSIAIPDGVTEIKNETFHGCSKLASVTIPVSVASIGVAAFYDCSGLAEISIPDGVTTIEARAFRGCSNLVAIDLPESLTEIGDEAFRGCSELESISIPDCVATIGVSAFYDCSKLTKLIIPDGVTAIQNSTFLGCESLGTITIPDSVKSIGGLAFRRCHVLSSIEIPGAVTNIGPGAFYDCFGLTEISIPDGVERIEGSTFRGCTALSTITIPDSVTSVGDAIVRDCWQLAALRIPATVESIATNAFYRASLNTLYLPSHFEGRTESFAIPANCTVIFYDYEKLPLSIVSDVGEPDPAVGVRACTSNSLQTCSVGSPVLDEGRPGFRYACTGWTGTGNAPASGSGTNIAFRIREETTITWNWETQVLVSVSVSGGTSEFGSKWTPIGNSVSAEIVPSAHLYEIVLSGDTNGVTLAGTTLTIPANGPRAIDVTVAEVKLPLDISSAHGTPTPSGRTFWSWNETVNASVVEPAPSDGVRLACTGWTGTGSVPAIGTGKSVSFSITEDSTIQWNWDERILVECEINCNTVSVEPIYSVVETNEAFGNIVQGYRTYTYGLSATNLVPGSVSVLIDGMVTLRDSVTGRLVRASASAPSYINYGSGTVNYATGLVSFYVNSTATESKSISILYSSQTETGKTWTLASAEGGDSVWLPRNGQNVEFSFSRTDNACVWSLSGETNGVVVDIERGVISIPADAPHSVQLFVREFTPDETVAASDGEPVLWTGTEEWISVEDGTATSGYCMRSKPAGAGESVGVSATVEGPGTLSFDWRISSSRGHYARFYLDDTKTNELTRSTAWSTASYVLGKGTHALRWTYEKGTGATGGEDAAFLDNVRWEPFPAITLEGALDATNLVWTTDGDAPWSPQNAVSFDGEDAARSGEVVGNETSRLSTTMQGAGTLAWKWKAEVVGIAGVEVYLDGEDLYDDGIFLEGSSGWADVSLAIEGEGEHTIVFEFWNGGTATTVSDCAFIDQVSWTPSKPASVVVEGVVIPTVWIADEATAALVAAEGNYAAAAAATAANGVNKVWECYVAGISPTNETARFEARIEFDAAGKPVVTWTPDLNENGTKHERVYRVLGAKALGAAAQWDDVTDLADPDAAGYRFFKAKVSLPE